MFPCSLHNFEMFPCSPEENHNVPWKFFVKYCTSDAQYMIQNIQFLLDKRIIAPFTNKHEISEQNELQMISYS